MRYTLLGKSGLRVSQVCLGAMTFGTERGWGATKEESKAVFDAFAQAGGNFIDTANHYTGGVSEGYLGEFMGSDREWWVLATKYSLSMRLDDPNGGGNHRKNMVQSVEKSLKRLKTDYIDLYWLHVWDYVTPIDEVMRALDDLVRAGKILYIGISDTPAWVVARANTLAELRGWSSFVGLQIEYSLIQRTPERELLPMAKTLGLGVTAWSPLGMGVLTGKYNRPAHESETQRGANFDMSARATERNLAIADEVLAIAGETGYSPAQVALCWLRAKNGIIPIIGARRLNQLKDNLGYLDIELSPEHIQRLDTISRIEMGFPHDFVHGVQIEVHGNTYNQLYPQNRYA